MAIAMGRKGRPPETVAKVVEHALTASRPKTRYLVGDAKIQAPLLGLLPDRLGDALSPAASGERAAPFAAEHETLRAEVRAWVEETLRPHAREWEPTHWFPDEVFRWCAARGYLGPQVRGRVRRARRRLRRRRGVRRGAGALRLGRPGRRHRRARQHRHAADLEVRHRRAEAPLPGARHPRGAHRRAGDHRARRRLRRGRASGPRARREDGGWVVNGSKMFITNGVRADFMVTAVKTRAEGGHHGLSFLIVDRGEGVSASPIEKLGWHASDTALDRLRRRVGARGEPARRGGPRLLPDHGQLPVGAPAHGPRLGGRRCRPRWSAPWSRGARDRGNGQATRHALADCAVRLETGRALTYHALRRFLDGGDAVREVTMAKLATQRAAFEVADTCLSIAGPDPESGARRPRRPPRPHRRRDRRDHEGDPGEDAGAVASSSACAS